MSDSRPKSIEECIADITECPICNEVLQDNRCFPCLHTFCLKCLESYKKKNAKGKSLPCPVCRGEFPIPKSVKDLSRNFFIDKLIDAHKIKQPDVLPKSCEVCSDDAKVVPATRFCCDCRQNVCLSCEKQHKRIAATMMHKIVDGSNVTDAQKITPRPTYCVAHRTKEAEMYCLDCKKLICWECNSVSHKSHTNIKIIDAAKELTAKLERHVKQISEHLRTKQDDIQNVIDGEKVYTDEIDTELANICKELNKLYRDITDNGDKLKKALAATTSAHLATFQKLRSKLESDVNGLKKHKVYIEQMIHLGNVSDLCDYTDKLISNTATMVAENTCRIITPPLSHLSGLELQDLLIGRRTDIEQQYKSTSDQERQVLQLDLHPDDCAYSKEERSPNERFCETSPSQLTHSGTINGTEKKITKTGSKNIKEALKALSIPRLHPRHNDSKETQSKGGLHGALKTLSLPMSQPRHNDNKESQSKGEFHENKVADLRSEEEPEEPSSCSDDTVELKREVGANDKRENVLLKCSNLPESTETTAAETLPTCVKDPGESFAENTNCSLLRTVCFENGGAISGITVLDSKIYTVLQNRDSIQVYDSAAFVLRNSFTVLGLVNPNDIASCNFNKCLYICDWSKGRIFRFQIGCGMEHLDWSTDKDLGGLSVTGEHNVLLAGYLSNKLKEYTSKGMLIRSISLEEDFKPWHAVKLISGGFVACHGIHSNGIHRVCLIGENGKLRSSFGGATEADTNQLRGPYHLAVDKSGCILVTDCNNRRILLLSHDLKFIKEFIPSSADVLRRARRICLDEAAGRLYVADNIATGSETKDGRILVFSIS